MCEGFTDTTECPGCNFLRDEIERLRKGALEIEVFQHDWMPGWAAFEQHSTERGPVHLALNIGSTMLAIELGDLPREDLPYMIAESLMHEIMHALEEWAGVEFNDERIEELLAKYREAAEAEE